MIPRLIHQTWKVDVVPEKFQGWSRSWEAHNPGWTRILWSDRMLLDFVAKHYPEMLDVYCAYPRGILRADAARYMLLHHFGGIYADIDVECLSSLEPLAGEDRVVLCHEPPVHWPQYVRTRGLPYLLFNGVMASPAGHPFWRFLIDQLPTMASARDVLDATGPILLTSAALAFPDRSALSIRSCHLFNPFDKLGRETPDYSGDRPRSLTRHYWAGTWIAPGRDTRIVDGLKKRFYRARHWLTRGPRLNPARARAAVDPAALRAAPPSGDAVAILVPLRDAADHVAPFLEAVAALDYPKDRIKLAFCEGDSRDGTFERLSRAVEPLRARYRDVVLLRRPLGGDLPREGRWKLPYQRSRRAGLAVVRNHLIDHGLGADDDWALWLDVDVWKFPRDVLRRLRAAEARIVTPHCVVRPGGPSFDQNSFVRTSQEFDWAYWRDLRGGVHMPPAGFRRLYLSDLRSFDRVALDSVGGTMLLVDAALHRGGLRFPERPYEGLLETEGFGALARDLGVAPVGLPKLEILHVPW